MIVVITGASRGIGKAIAEAFASNGYDLCISSQNGAALHRTAEELMTRFPSVVIHAKPFNLAKKEQAVECGKWCLGFGFPEILVNNAGIFQPGSVYNEPEGSLEKHIEVNLYSAYHLTRTVLPAMMKDSSPANTRHIFNICSIAALHAYRNGGAYSISKYAMYGFSKNLREEMKPHNIKVTSVHPGAVMTDSWEGFDNSSNRIMEAADVAKLVFAASQLSPQACAEDIILRPQLGDL